MQTMDELYNSLEKRSKNTARVRKKPSVPAQWLYDNGLIIPIALDFGCGRSPDGEAFNMVKFDPYWKPNYHALTIPYNTILCTYVLNVMGQTRQDEVIGTVYKLLKLGGIAYITVRRDIKSITRGRGAYQYPVDLSRCGFESIRKQPSYEIYKLERN